MWEPRRLTTLWAFTACYRESFITRRTFLYATTPLLVLGSTCSLREVEAGRFSFGRSGKSMMLTRHIYLYLDLDPVYKIISSDFLVFFVNSHSIHCPISTVHLIADIKLLTYLRSSALLDKLPIVQPLKNFPAFYGTRRFITVFTRALHWSLS
jgi:hypothetical protein